MTDNRTLPVEPGWLTVLRDLGIDARRVLARAELPADLFQSEGRTLTVGEFFRLWGATEAEADDPALAIRLADAMTAEAFDPMVFAALCSPNLTMAMQRIAAYKRLTAPTVVTVEVRDGALTVAKCWDGTDEYRIPASLAALELIKFVKIARMGLRRRVVPERVTSPLPMVPSDAYTSYLGVAPTRGETRSVTFSARDASAPFVTSRQAMWGVFEADLRNRLTELEVGIPIRDRVHQVLLQSLPSGRTTVEGVARQLGLSTRTLQRRLRAEGTSFKEVRRATRTRLSRHYLTQTRLAYREIAFLVGFREPSSFFRAFRGWTGETPERARQAARV